MCGGPTYCRYSSKHACRIDPALHVTAAPPRVGSLHRTPPVLRIIPEPQRGLYTGEASEACHGFTPPAVLDTPCRTESAHRTCRAHQDMCVTAERVPTLGDVSRSEAEWLHRWSAPLHLRQRRQTTIHCACAIIRPLRLEPHHACLRCLREQGECSGSYGTGSGDQTGLSMLPGAHSSTRRTRAPPGGLRLHSACSFPPHYCSRG